MSELSVFDKKLAHHREAQERKQERKLKKRYGMTKYHKENLIKSLEKQINEATDPQLRARLTGQLTRVLTTKPEARAKRSKDFPIETKKTSTVRDIYTGSVFDAMSDGRLITHHVVIQVEAKCRGRGGWLALSRAEKDALLAEVKATLTKEELAAYEAYGADEA